MIETVDTVDEIWDNGRLVISGDNIQIKDDGNYRFELKLSAKEGFAFDNNLSINDYYGVDGIYNLQYAFPIEPDGQHTMIVTGEFANIISASPLINLTNIESADIARLIALVISEDYEGAVNFLLDDGVPFSEKVRSIDSFPVSDDKYSYQLVLKTNEGFTFTNALDFKFEKEVYGYKLVYFYDLTSNGHTLEINVTIDPCAEGHAWNSEPTVDKPATCTEAGLQSFHCSRCDATQEATIIPPLGHQWNTTYTVDVPATETAAGSQSIHCSVCGAIKDGSTQIIPQTAIIDLPTVKISKPSAGKKKVTVKWKKVNKKNLKKIERLEIQVATDPHFTNIVKTADVSKKKTSKTIKGLTSKHTYYVQIRAYKNAADGRHVSQWRAKRVKTK